MLDETMMADIAAYRARLSPERPALAFEGRWYSYAEVHQRVCQLASKLAEAGVRAGDRVSILAFNHLAHVELLLATAKLGFIYTPLNYRYSALEQRQVCKDIQPRLLFYDREHSQEAETTAVPSICLDDYPSYLASANDTPLPAWQAQADSIQMILFTGGTSGFSQGAMQPYRQSFFNAVNTVFSWGLRPEDATIQATPCFHAGINALSMPLFYLGGRVVIARHFQPSDYLRSVAQERISLLFMVPTMYQMLSEDPDFAHSDLSSVRWAISGGAPCPEPVRQAFAARDIRFKQGYGLTEAGVNCFSIDLDDAEAKPHSVGRPVLYSQAVLRDDSGQAVAPGEVGELTLRGPHVFSGYYNNIQASAIAFRQNRDWLWTGDLAQQDEEGFFTIVGRRKEMFISGGENVYPLEIEHALYQHPAIAECAVMGVPDTRWGEVGLAAVVLREQAKLDAESLRSYLKERLARYKVPKHILIQHSLPKSAAGKILKKDISSAFLESQT